MGVGSGLSFNDGGECVCVCVCVCVSLSHEAIGYGVKWAIVGDVKERIGGVRATCVMVTDRCAVG
jgi:hypothetical protein